MSNTAPTPPPTPSPWLFSGPVDLGLGYGVAYLASIPLLAWLVGSGRVNETHVWVGTALGLFFSTPHYGATLLRVYEHPQDRRRYAAFTVWITALLLGLFGVGLWNVTVASLLVTAYVTWSPWHFSGQNYGLAVMYLRRRGIAFDATTKRDLYASFLLSAFLAILVIHEVGSKQVFAIGTADPSGTVGVLSLGLPSAVVRPLAAVTTLAYLFFLGRTAGTLLRGARAIALLPVAALLLTQALWFTVPALSTALASSSLPAELALPLSVVWISTAHAIQYLWVTAYYARQTGDGRRPAPFFLLSLAAGACLSLPVVILFPNVLGPYFPNAPGAAVLVFSVVNLHHFILDGAIWKLRDGAVAKALLRRPGPRTLREGTARPRRWVRTALLSAGAATVLFQLYLIHLSQLATSSDTPYAALRTTAARLDDMGKATPELWARVGQLAETEDPNGAMAAYRRVVGADAAPPVWVADRLAWLLLNHRADDPASVAQAGELADYVGRTLGPARPEGFLTRGAALAAAAKWEEASAIALQGIQVARKSGNERLASELARRLAVYRRAARDVATATANTP